MGLTDREGLSVQVFCFHVPALCFVEQGQAMIMDSYVRVFAPKRLLINSPCLQETRLCLCVLALQIVHPGEIIQACNRIRVIRHFLLQGCHNSQEEWLCFSISGTLK